MVGTRIYSACRIGCAHPVFRRRPAWIAGRPHTGGSVCCYRASRFDGENDGLGCEVDYDTAHQCKKGRFLFTMSLQCRMLSRPARGAIIAELVLSGMT